MRSGDVVVERAVIYALLIKRNKVLKKQLLIILFFTLFYGEAPAQQKIIYPFATKHNRDSIEKKLIVQIEETVLLPLNEKTYTKYAGAFWAMELMLYRPKNYLQKIAPQITQIQKFDVEFQRAFIEMLYTLYPRQFSTEIKALWNQMANEKVKAMALEYLAKNNIFPKIEPTNSFLHSAYFLPYFERWHSKKKQLPFKGDFLNKDFLPGQSVLCSFQSPDRNQPGYLMIRQKDGTWLTDENNRPLQYPQLARSISNLPWYLTNGNTPQGLFKITGFDTSSNNWIGPTVNLQMVLPFENGPSVFFGGDTSYAQQYENLLGPLKKYPCLWQTYRAGNIGRSEIIAHGTTINPEFYKQQPYFPNTPSLGCLCSPEMWNEVGERISSVQQEWISELQKIKEQPVYFIVADVQDF